MRIALLSDIHGNSIALEAVLADIEKRAVDQILNLGDIFYGPLDPMGTFELLKKSPMICVSGNQDRTIIESLGEEVKNKTLEYVLTELSTSAISFIQCLPFDYKLDAGIYMCHATPQKDNEYLIEKLNYAFVGVKENDEIEVLLADIEERIVVCGHSHLPRVLKTASKTIINPGSVGLQAYDDDLPIFHEMENFSTDARFSVLTIENKQLVSVEQVSVPYKFELAASLAEKNHRPDWAKWIRTGRC